MVWESDPALQIERPHANAAFALVEHHFDDCVLDRLPFDSKERQLEL